MQRLHTFSLEQIMVYVNIPTDALRHSRAAQELIEEGRLEGRQQGEALGEEKATLRQLTHRCGPLSPATTARIQALPLEQLEALGLALLDFSGAADLAAWLAAEAHAG
jgi:predicted transposase YdaD